MPTDAPPHLDLVRLYVLVTQEQKERITRIARARRTPSNRISSATVLREALDVGLEEQARRYLPAEEEEQQEP